jgi:phage terminase Nu1 subunit (DNA packaging protein)
VRAYARARGVSHTAVAKAIQSGRIRRALKPGPRGHQLIDEELANQEWTEASNPAQQRERHRQPEQRDLPSAAAGQGNLFGIAENDPRGEPEERLTHARAQAVRTALQAKLLQLELDEKRGNLVDRARVGSEVFTVCRTIREAVLTIPDRLAGELAGKEVHEVREGLAVELRAALVELGQLLAKFGAEAPPT